MVITPKQVPTPVTDSISAMQLPAADWEHEVLTLEETAAYLRLPLEVVERQAARGQIPGRRIEDTWRFLKAAIDEWLRNQDSRKLGGPSCTSAEGVLIC